MNWAGSWIWVSENTPGVNSFVRYRRAFNYVDGAAKIHITADSRYVLYVNGEYLGQGPVRSWPGHWSYDTYDLSPHLLPGRNVVAVLVNHFGDGNFQYIPAPPGLLAQIELCKETIPTDDAWKAASYPAFLSVVPRVSVQEGFEEQFDARYSDGWEKRDYDDFAWSPAVQLRPADDGFHKDFTPRSIPFLTMEPVLPVRIVDRDEVRSNRYIFTIQIKPYLAPGDRSSERIISHAYLATRIWSPEECEAKSACMVANWQSPCVGLKLNGQAVEDGFLHLRSGWNDLAINVSGSYHISEYDVCIDGPEGVSFACMGEQGGSPWAVIGPFALSGDELFRAENAMDEHSLVLNPSDMRFAVTVGENFWASGDVSSTVGQPYFQQVASEHLPPENVVAQAMTDQPVGDGVVVDDEENLLSGAGWTTVYPSREGTDVRLLLDFGRELLGYHRFEIDAPAGTVLDAHNFEFIQPDGRRNYAEGMNNTFRYICKEGRQEYQTLLRRGLQYTYLTLRNMTGPVRLRRVQVLFSTYPQSHRGSFACSDAQLSSIWEVGAHTLRCCSEDTYTDCPTYEQTFWVGDARNEALVDWSVNGDPRLWYRCLEQAGQSLERSVLTESNVPSAWINILPAWSFLWMRSCREYMFYTGDEENGRKLFDLVKKNVEGISAHINEKGLFDIRAWNMFDWAPMDTPSTGGVVTHLNCLAVHALTDVAEMAEWLCETSFASEWRALGDSIKDAVNEHLWNEEMGAYTDCLRGDIQSSVFSQQTQTAACMSSVASGTRADKCREIMHHPPEGFVRAGSPFFEFFLLEAYQREGKVQEFLDTIRKDWGFMVDMGASTFWESWSMAGADGRLTRSHCHGWSAAPTYFLGSYILGIRPGGPGFSPVIVEPHPGDLLWCRGAVPTPDGDIYVRWENKPDAPFILRITAPERCKLQIHLPHEGDVILNGVLLGKGLYE